MAEEKKEHLTPEQEYMKEKSAILAEMSEVFKKHNCDPNLSIEILAEMLMQIFVGMQWMTDEKMEHYVFPFFKKLKERAKEVLFKTRNSRAAQLRRQEKQAQNENPQNTN
ncbi:MAG: hypothetical protein J5658_08645 [Prevotella sp.]|nr:hypothetical protein [Prevotella sp.]